MKSAHQRDTCTRFGTSLGSHQQMNEENVLYIHTLKYYSAIKKSEILTFTAKWMKLEDTLRKTSQTQSSTTDSLSYVEATNS
jgi:hypothetical protein